MHWLQIVRLCVLSFVLLCSVIVVSISAHVTSFAVENFAVYYNFAVLGIVTGGLTLVTVSPMLIIDALRTGAFTSMVMVELIWLSILWVFWIATGALTADQTSAVFSTCNFADSLINQLCHETQAIEGFSISAWLALLGYTITLFVIAPINAKRGVPIWKISVRESPPVAPANPNNMNTNISGPHLDQQQYQNQPQQQQQPYMQQQQGQQPVLIQQYQPPQALYAMPNVNGSGPQSQGQMQMQMPPSPVGGAHQQQPSQPYTASNNGGTRNSGFYPIV